MNNLQTRHTLFKLYRMFKKKDNKVKVSLPHNCVCFVYCMFVFVYYHAYIKLYAFLCTLCVMLFVLCCDVMHKQIKRLRIVDNCP